MPSSSIPYGEVQIWWSGSWLLYEKCKKKGGGVVVLHVHVILHVCKHILKQYVCKNIYRAMIVSRLA